LVDQPLSVNEMADNFDISRSAVSKHIKILNECGVVAIRKEGRRRYCRTDPRKLKEVAQWANQYRAFWSKRLDVLEDILEEENNED
jgi:DNA-binding transcriptional ArsR family regulator